MRASAERSAAQGSQGFRPSDRLRRRFEYRHVQSTGRRVHGRRFLWMVSQGEATQPRLGITVTKKVANAVGRNRIKRVVRETFRRHRELLPEGIELVAIAKREAVDVDYETCLAELKRAAAAIHKMAAPAPETTP